MHRAKVLFQCAALEYAVTALSCTVRMRHQGVF